MIKHTETIRRLLPTNCWIVFDHFVGLVLEGLNSNRSSRYLPVQSQQVMHQKKGLNYFSIFQ